MEKISRFWCKWSGRKLPPRKIYHKDHVSSITALCGLMRITNLARPEWLTVSCVVPLLQDILCAIKPSNHSFDSTQLTETACGQSYIAQGNSCILIVWNNGTIALTHICFATRMKYVSYENVSDISFLKEAVPLSPLLSGTRTFPVLYKYNEIVKTYTQVFVSVKQVKGYQLCSSLKKQVDIGSNIHKCGNGHFLLILLNCTIKQELAFLNEVSDQCLSQPVYNEQFWSREFLSDETQYWCWEKASLVLKW